MTFDPILIWFLVGLFLILTEFLLPGIVLIFFGISAWIVSLTTFFSITNTIQSQFFCFAIISIVLVAALRKWVKGKFYGHISNQQDPSSDLNEFIGKTVVVLKDVHTDLNNGKVEFKGTEWNAISDELISKDHIAVIKKVNGITLEIEKRGE